MKFRDGYDGQLVDTIYKQLPYELHPKKDINTEFIKLNCKGLLTIRKGYGWDYATVPLTHWASNRLAGKKSKYPTLIHDALCQLYNQGLLTMDPTRIHTDTFFHQLLLERDFWRIRALVWFKATRLGAKFGNHAPKKVIEVW